MSFYSLIEKYKTVKEKKETAPQKNLCACELYETGPEELLVTLWHPLTGKYVFGPGVQTRFDLYPKRGERPRHACHELHSSAKLVGCYLSCHKLPNAERADILSRIYAAWGKK